MANYATIAGRERRRRTLTSQVEFIKGREDEQVKNAAGGVSFKMDDFDRLMRFLILGVESNTYYTNQKTLVLQNVECLDRCLQADPRRVVDMVVDVSTNNRAFKQDAGLFVLAAAASFKGKASGLTAPNRNRYKYEENYQVALAEYNEARGFGTDDGTEVRQYALANLHRVARTGYSLYRFAGFVKSQRGFGRSLRRAFADWLTKKPIDKLAYQSWKYKNRDGWSMRDIMRLAHPVTDDMVRAEIFTYMANPKQGKNPLLVRASTEDMNTRLYTQAGKVRKNGIIGLSALAQIEAVEKLLHLEGSRNVDVDEAVKLITDHRLTHEAIPSHLRKSPKIWEALLNDMPVTAMVRNLGTMTANGLLTPMSASQKKVVNALNNAEQIVNSRAHPMQFLIAARQYGMGHGNRGNLSWSPNQKVMDALDNAFYASFGNVPVTGGNILVAVDTSGSMSWGGSGGVMGIEGWNPIMAAGAMALVTLATEPNAHLIGYDTKYHEIQFTQKNRIDTIVDRLSRHQGGGTNTNLPVQYAWDKKLDVDAIVSYTDNETWAGQARYAGYYRSHGGGHVTEWVTKYADKFGPFKFLNCGMTATGTSDVDAGNPMMFELFGMDANTPRIISEYVQGNL